MADYKVSDVEEKTRKQWLYSTITLLFAFPFAVFVFAVVFFKLAHIPRAFLFRELAGALGGLIPLWLIWHCCYRKYGTRLITLWLFLSPLSQIKEINIAIQQGIDPILLFVITIQLALFIWWYVLSLRIRKINKFVRAKALLAI